MSGFGIQQVVDIANQMRSRNPSVYGQRGSRPGFIKDGFRNAVQDATQEFYWLTGKTPSQAAI